MGMETRPCSAGKETRMSLTREYIEAVLADPPSENIRALCELALRGLALEKEAIEDENDIRRLLSKVAALRAENERLRESLKEILVSADKSITFEEKGRAVHALERKSSVTDSRPKRPRPSYW
jgi:hypothetical protein